jgi:hypothetical protein
MLISLDYDRTYTKDKELWNRFIEDATKCGHEVICLTMRYPTEPIKDIPCEIIYTSRKAKLKWAESNGIAVDIWIDDKPSWLFDDAII